MKKIALVTVLVLSFAALRAMDVNAPGPNTWVKIIDKVPNQNNGAYENDFQADAGPGLVWVGPGHRGSPQDNHWYIYDPLASARGVPEWTSPHSAIRPPKRCLSHFCVSTSDWAIMSLGGSSGHQNSIGAFNATYTRINDRLWTAYDIYFYSIPENKWRGMKAPGRRHPGAGGLLAHHRFKYDPVHDVAVVHGGDNSGTVLPSTWIYHLPSNSWLTVSQTGGPGLREMYASDVDTRRGVFYVMGGGPSHWGTYIPDMWALDLESRAWSQVTTNVPGGNSSYVLSMAYNPHDDALLYLQGMTGYRLHSFDAQSKVWSELAVPSLAPSTVGRLNFSARHNLLFLLGGSSGSDGRIYDGLWAYRQKAHDLDSLKAFLPNAAPAAFISTAGGTVQLTWNAVAGALSYNVYRGDADPYPRHYAKLNASPVTAAAYTDASAQSGQAFAYRVAPVFSGNVQGPLSRHLYTRPPRPLDLAASVESQTQVQLTWTANAENDIAGYNVYRARGVQMYNTTFLYTKLNSAPVAATAWTDSTGLSDGVARGYVVTAVNAFGLESGYSPVATTFPDPPLWVRTIPVSGQTQIHWQGPARQTIQGVNIYVGRADSTTQPYNGATPVTATPYIRASTSGTYSVRAINVLGQEGFLSDQIGPNDAQYTNGDGPLPKFDISKYPGELSSLSVQAALRTAEPSSATLRISPNPCRVGGMVRVAGVKNAVLLKMYDCRGRYVAQMPPGRTPASLSPGLYVVETAGTGSTTLRAKIVFVK